MVDFYDGSILYNFEQSKLTICDIDFFQKNLYSIKLGRIFGEQVVSKHLKNMNCMHKITSETNVFVLAGIAFAFIGGKNDKKL